MTNDLTLFGSGLNDIWREFETPYSRWFTPTSKYVGEDKGDRIELSVDIPGVTKQDVEITYENGILRISAERDNRKYNQSYTVRQDLDASKISAKLENGVLLVTLPKTEKAKALEIKVK